MDREATQAKKVCFVVCPIGSEGSKARSHSDKVLHHIIEPPCINAGFVVHRADQVQESGLITKRVIQDLLVADLVIADLTANNPNVFYELGVRHFTGLPIIHIRDKTQTLPFDVADCRTIMYDLTDPDSIEEVRSEMEAFLQTVSPQKLTANPVTEVLRSYAFPLPLSLDKRIDPITHFEQVSHDLLRELRDLRQERDSFLQKSIDLVGQIKGLSIAASTKSDYSGLWQSEEGLVKIIQTGDRVYGDYQWQGHEWIGSFSGRFVDTQIIIARWHQGVFDGIVRWVVHGLDKLIGYWWHQWEAYSLEELLSDPQLAKKLPFHTDQEWVLVRQ